MGSFSWLRADRTTKRNNLAYNDKYKILVPEVYGGGYIKDKYYDYGYINYDRNTAVYVDGKGTKHSLTGIQADLYGVLFYWNNPKEIKKLQGTDDMPDMMKIICFGETLEQYIRCGGIEIGCYDKQVDKLKYPLKLVSASYKGTYEECEMRSYGDPNQGFCKTYWR
jgi:signal peptidase I